MMCLAIVKTKFNDSGSITSSTRLRDIVAHKIMPMSNAVQMLKAATPSSTSSGTPTYIDSIDTTTYESKNTNVIATSANTNSNKYNNNPIISNNNIETVNTTTTTTVTTNNNNVPSRLLARMKSNSNDMNNDMIIETHIPMTKNANTHTETTPTTKGSSFSKLRNITNEKIITPNRVIAAIANTTTPTYKVLYYYYFY